MLSTNIKQGPPVAYCIITFKPGLYNINVFTYFMILTLQIIKIIMDLERQTLVEFDGVGTI